MIGNIYIPLQIYGEPTKCDDDIVVKGKGGTHYLIVRGCTIVAEHFKPDESEHFEPNESECQ